MVTWFSCAHCTQKGTGGVVLWDILFLFGWYFQPVGRFSEGLVDIKSHCFQKISCEMSSLVVKINDVGCLQIPRGHVSVPCWLNNCSVLCYGCKYPRADKELWRGAVNRCSFLSTWLSHGMMRASLSSSYPVAPSEKSLGICCKKQREQI